MERIEELEPEVKRAVTEVINQARFKRNYQSRKLVNCEVYAYPTPRGFAWGVNSAPDYCNTARGVVA